MTVGKADLKLVLEEQGVTMRNFFVSISDRKFGTDAACGILHSVPESPGNRALVHMPVCVQTLNLT